MTHGKIGARFLAGVAAVTLASCASVPPYEDAPARAEKEKMYQARAAEVRALDRWSVDGKLAVSDGEDGGSGRLEWRSEPGMSRLDFRGALGRGAWRLDIQPGHAVLNLANGDTWEAREVSTLVRTHVGWEVPVDALEWWVRGLPAPGPVTRRDLDNEGRMSLLSQHGWNVEYKRYGEFSGITLPTRLEARSGERRVKFVMRDWAIPESPGNDS